MSRVHPIGVVSGALFLVALLLAAAIARADYTTLYDQNTLNKAFQTYAANLDGMWSQDLVGRLPSEERAAAAKIQLELPLVGANRHPLDFYADPAAGKVSIPILSVKFLDDLMIAGAWLQHRGCTFAAVSDYAGILRYGRSRQPPIASLPPPLTALGVPANVLDNKAINQASGNGLKSAIYFLAAHELAHVLRRHRRYDTISASEAQAQEQEADAYALNVMQRIGVPPVGMVIFLAAVSRFEPAPGDFRTPQDYERDLRQRHTHPLTSSRMMALAQGIRGAVKAFSRIQSDPAAWEPRLLGIARDIDAIGKDLDDRKIRDYQRGRSLDLPLSSLRECAG